MSVQSADLSPDLNGSLSVQKHLRRLIMWDVRWLSLVKVWSGLPTWAKNLRELSLHIRRFQNYWAKQNTLYLLVYRCAFPVLLHCSPVEFLAFLRKDFKILHRRLSPISLVSFLSVDDLCVKLCYQRLSPREPFPQELLSVLTHPLQVVSQSVILMPFNSVQHYPELTWTGNSLSLN